jgi:predicted DNA-binding transcriptional regulator YafY
MPDRLERLVNLTATLLDTRRPLTLDELAERVEPRYPTDRNTRRRQFERDKETLRELGVPVRVEPVHGFGTDIGYRIRPQDYYLPQLDLSEAELAALHLAVTAVRLEGDAGREALAKLGGLTGDAAEVPLAEFPAPGALGPLFEAVSRHAPLSFAYRGEARSIDPYGVVLRGGHWYLVGHDHDRDAPRAFRVDRMEGSPEVGPPGSFEPPAGLDPADLVRADPLTFGDDRPVEARVLVDAPRAGWVVEQLGEEAVTERRKDGAVVVGLTVVNRDAFRAFVLDLLDHAEVLGPPELRAEMVAWLDAIARERAEGGRASRTPASEPKRKK